MTLKALKFLGYTLLVAILSVLAFIVGSIMSVGGLVLLGIAIILDGVVLVIRPFMSEETKQMLDRRLQ